MEYRLETWTIDDLVNKYRSSDLYLNPSYQRKFIWSLDDQQTLIDSITKGFPIPNIFLFEKSQGKFEMVDGQQRTRTILGFINKQFKTFDGDEYSIQKFPRISKYKVSVIIIEKIEVTESIELFYSLVNKAGIHLNRPELKKAEFFETNFLRLVTEVANSPRFTSLELFTDSTSKRMIDIDFISELVTLLIEGNTDKKNAVDKKFEEDIANADYKSILNSFNDILDIIYKLNIIYPIKKTRYKQRNDFYTIFGFIKESDLKDIKQYELIYQLLIKFNDHIIPSNDKCPPFQNYTFHCISQSNSKNARDERLKILNQIFLNPKNSPNKIQKEILKYFGLNPTSEFLVSNGKFHTIDISKLQVNERI